MSCAKNCARSRRGDRIETLFAAVHESVPDPFDFAAGRTIFVAIGEKLTCADIVNVSRLTLSGRRRNQVMVAVRENGGAHG
jgi:hypothetical protein